MDRVVIGVDPHKLSVTIEARDNREILRATGRFGTDARSYHQLLKVARQWPERIWAVEGANGIGRPLTQRLLASGEQVPACPPSSPPAPESPVPGRAARRRRGCPCDRHGRLAGQGTARGHRRSGADGAADAV